MDAEAMTHKKWSYFINMGTFSIGKWPKGSDEEAEKTEHKENQPFVLFVLSVVQENP